MRFPSLRLRGRQFRRAVRRTWNYEHVLGTSLELQVRARSDGVARSAERQVLAEIDRLDAILSGWSESSELARWCHTHEVDVPVSSDLAEVLLASSAWCDRTSGAFNPAACALANLWRNGREDDIDDTLVRELQRPLWQVNRDRDTASRLTTLPVSLDGIAKGYIVSRAATRAREVDGVTDVLLNIGGDLQHLGDGFVSIAVMDPAQPRENARPISAIRIRNAAVATSGGYHRGFESKGRRISHIFDPRTGAPASRVVSASALAPDCTTADALCTAFSVMHPDESVTLANALPGVGCLVVEADGTITTSAAWSARTVTGTTTTWG